MEPPTDQPIRTTDLEEAIDEVAVEHDFSGVVRIDADGRTVVARAYGMADRGHEIPNRVGTVFALASGAKTFAALTVMSLVEDGAFSLDTSAREFLGTDLPRIADGVTIEHLLCHRSGIGDYFDEEEHPSITEDGMPVPVHRLASTEDYLSVLDGHPPAFDPGTGFAYNNGAYVILALIAERATGVPFAELVTRRVCEPAGLTHTAFRRTDELDGDVAVGYLWSTGLRTNALHLPVMGSGDGGIFSTAEDVHRLWRAFWGGDIVSEETVAAMTRPHDGRGDPDNAYGLGFWLRPSSHAVISEGYDAGISFRSVSYTDRPITHTVIANWSDGAWPMTRRVEALVAAEAD